MAVLNRDADRLQDALDGEVVDLTFAAELNTARSLQALVLGARPDQRFVGALRERLQTEAVALAPERRPPGSTPMASTPRRLAVGGGAIRALAGAAATLVVLAALVGVTAQSALPGQALYPMRLVLDHAAVSVQASDRDKGTTRLAQADRHLADAGALASPGDHPSDGIDTAVQETEEAAADGSRILLSDFGQTQDAAPLVTLRSFTDRTIAEADALAAVAPADSLPRLAALRSLLVDIRTSTLQTLAACTTCGSAGDEARQSLEPTATTSTAPTRSSSSATTTTRQEPRTQTTESASPPSSAPVPGPSAASGSVGTASATTKAPTTGGSTSSTGTAPPTGSSVPSGGAAGPTDTARVPTLTGRIPTLSLPGTITCAAIDCR